MTPLNLSQIRSDGGTQPRTRLAPAVVAEYAEAMASGAIFPPVVVFFDGKEYWLADGFHRVEAAGGAGREAIDADVRQGSQRDAILYSVGVNASHGLRRTNEDKRRAVLRLLEDAEWSAWSDSEIARRTSVSHTFVSAIRPSVTCNVASEKPIEKTYTTKHGTTSTMNTTNIGRKPAPEFLAEDFGEEDAEGGINPISDLVTNAELYIKLNCKTLSPDQKNEYLHAIITFSSAFLAE